MAQAFPTFESRGHQGVNVRIEPEVRAEVKSLADALGCTQARAVTVAVRSLAARTKRVESPRVIRMRARVSLRRVEAETGITRTIVRLYEERREAVGDARKRATLDRYYAALARKAKASAPPSGTSEPMGEK